MEKLPNIYQRINEVMKEVNYIQKSDKKVNNMYSFVSHDSVSAALHMPMANHGIVMTSSIVELNRDGNRTTLKVEVSFINADDPADKFSVFCYGDGIDQQDKGIGKAMSYAVKYALLKTFCLETGDDVEKDNINHSTAESDAVKQMSETMKNNFIRDFPEEDAQWFEVYIKKIMETMKYSKATALEKFFKKKEPLSDFHKWRDREIEERSKKAA
jgi:hypothetical protein